MQKAKNTPGSYQLRARAHARQILVALALTVGAAAFMVTALTPASQPAENGRR